MNKSNKSPNRQYPPLLEKLVPIALLIILVAMIALLGIAVSVAMGWFG